MKLKMLAHKKIILNDRERCLSASNEVEKLSMDDDDEPWILYIALDP